MKKKAFIFIASEQKGLLISFAKLLETNYGYEVCIVARDKYIKKLVDRLLPGRKNDIVLSEFKLSIDNSEIMQEALKIEKKYNISLSMILSEDRALGQGYLHNVEKIPDIIRSSWAHERKLKEIIQIIKIKEKIIKKCDFIIQLSQDKIVAMIGKKIGAKIFSPQIIKFGDRVFWSDNDFSTSSRFIQRLINNLESNINDQGVSYKIEAHGDQINRDQKYKYIASLGQASRIFINDTKNFIRGIQKKNSYHYLGWVPSVFRKVPNFRYVKSISKNIEQLSDYKVVFFPLHLEPEVALLNLSPELNNSMEIISWLSKSLPADVILVVKEQAQTFGVRSKWYYKHINKIGNVVWADPDIHSWSWIERADIVASITGTVGIESVHMNKTVISYGKHQIINYLPTVNYASNFQETFNIVNKLLSHPPNKIDFIKSQTALHKAQVESSIDLPEFKYIFRSNKLEDSVAKRALKLLYDEYLNVE